MQRTASNSNQSGEIQKSAFLWFSLSDLCDIIGTFRAMSLHRTLLLVIIQLVLCTFATVAGVPPTPTPTPTPGPVTANFNYSDGSGPGDAGFYPAGASFTFAINLNFVPGGNVANLGGFSYWFEQQNPLAPYYFAITNRDVSGSAFMSLQTPGMAYPQALGPSNPNDLGAFTQSGIGVGAGNYFIANLTISIDPSAPTGTYILENVTSGGKSAVISDDQGHTALIPRTTYTVNVVPFKMISIAPDGNGNIVLQCQGVPNSVNRIEWSPDLSPNSFQTLTSQTPDISGTFSYTDMNPGSPRKFYRLAFP